ncbi:hypothetical protein D910_04354 [Dendroctonus ponderosae]|uniref:Uncharacterized protein n=3 Tax=Dendroctonus ponderosae TaxID=77166 RepID=U4U8M9_DENPD|nr:hypothetical protein D910_04354 [Dendroctonus ponderosae]
MLIEVMSIQLPQAPGEFIADHPFLVLLKSRGSIVDEEREARIYFDGTPLFYGRILNPKA